jgi:hypothetical protein
MEVLMQTQTYQTRTGATQYRPVMTASEYTQSDNAGFCLACGEDAYGVEPDAGKYTCESCGAPKVYGLEQLLMMGLLRITE